MRNFSIYLVVDEYILSNSRADDSAGFTFTTSLMLHILLPPPFCYPRFLLRDIPVYSELLRFQGLRSKEAREETRMNLATAILSRFTVLELY